MELSDLIQSVPSPNLFAPDKTSKTKAKSMRFPVGRCRMPGSTDGKHECKFPHGYIRNSVLTALEYCTATNKGI